MPPALHASAICVCESSPAKGAGCVSVIREIYNFLYGVAVPARGVGCVGEFANNTALPEMLPSP